VIFIGDLGAAPDVWDTTLAREILTAAVVPTATFPSAVRDAL